MSGSHRGVEVFFATLLAAVTLSACSGPFFGNMGPPCGDPCAVPTRHVQWDAAPDGLTVAPQTGEPLAVWATEWSTYPSGRAVAGRLLLAATGSITVRDDLGRAVPGSTTMGQSWMQFMPSGALDPGVTYTATVAGARTLGGDPGDFSWTFQTWSGASLDATFGDRGILMTARAIGSGLAVAPGGESWTIGLRAPAQGSGGEGAFVFKAGVDGAPDPSYLAANVMVSFVTPTEFQSVARDGSGRVLVAAFNRSPGGVSTVARLDPLGALDPSFGASGLAAVTGPGLQDTRQRALRVLEDGRLVLAFGSLYESPTTYALVRLLADGSIDPGFAIAGVLRAPGKLVGLEVLPSGGLLVATTTATCGARLERYGPNGAADPTFGDGGARCLAALGGAQAMKLDAVGRILVAGSTGPSTSALLRLTPDGLPDATFGNGGMATVARSSSLMSLAVAPDGHAAVSFDLGMADLYVVGPGGEVSYLCRLPSDVDLVWSIDPIAFDGDGRLYVAAGRRARPWSADGSYTYLSERYDALLFRFR